MKRKLMVTGAHGFVAGSILAQAGAAWEVHAVSRSAGPSTAGGPIWHLCDPLAAGAIARLFSAVEPDVVIHTAAVADIDFCQTNPAAARAANVDLTRELADACAAKGRRLVFCSTDTVFDGEHAPYAETAAPSPVNVYGETKATAEKVVSELGREGVIARLSLVMGLPFLGAGNSFLVRMLAAFKQGRSVTMPEREVRTPVDVTTVGRALLELAAGAHDGVFHLAGLNPVSRVELARAIARQFGFSPELVTVQPPAAMIGRAPRPRDVSLQTDRTRHRLKTPLPTLQDGLASVRGMDSGL